mmetsp:Transcript_14889/g.37624  ORF Transcript_14889/g.37624 Transcript_14889/m.37624 type:complete len:90 (+) Transcript_14889:546-815(+)
MAGRGRSNMRTTRDLSRSSAAIHSTQSLAHSISTEVSVAGLAAGDEASAQDGHSVETSAANLAAGGHAALALAGAHASETSLACMIRRR